MTTGELVAAHPFDPVVGHKRTLAMLSSEPATPAHAYLFVGPEGVGKGTVARAFARAVGLSHRRGPRR